MKFLFALYRVVLSAYTELYYPEAAKGTLSVRDAVFEKHNQSKFIGRDLQHVVLLRPSQEGLVGVAGSMLRKRDPLAPSELTDARKRAI